MGMRFRLYRERVTTLKEAVSHLFRQYSTVQEFWAVRNLSLEISRGEVVGIIGHNGSGKSTLLKLIAGVLEPTVGTVRAEGRISPMIELGAGFDHELSGRDNIYLNGAFLGFGRREMDQRYQSIVDFSELGDFIDLPVKNYSSGMYARLGFAIATAVEPDILIIDEILAVGDERFQRKCTERFSEFKKRKTTMIYVSHALETVKAICERVVVMHHGVKVFDGKPDRAIEKYRELMSDPNAPAVAAV